MESSSTAATSGRGRGNRSHRNRRKNNNNHPSGPGKGAPAATSGGVPPPPQIKLALRHIGNPTKYGTVKAILEDLILPLVEVCNKKSTLGTPSSSASGTITSSTFATSNSGFWLDVDHVSKRHLIDEEEAVLKYMKDWEREQLADDEENTELEKEESKKDPAATEESSSLKTDAADEQRDELSQGATTAVDDEVPKQEVAMDVVVAPAPRAPANMPIITVRPLYVLPPKKSRRRGDKPGIAYILLTAPKIEKVEVPEMVPEDKVPSTVIQQKDGGQASETQRPSSVPDVTMSDATEVLTVASGTLDIAAAPSAESIAEKSATKKSTDYTRQVAQGRLLLQNALRLLQDLTSTGSSAADPSKDAATATNDATGSPSFTLEVDTAMNGKSWRWQSARVDRRENTLETTGDYKAWRASLEKQEAELKGRSKPAPGGGAPVSVTEEGGATSNATASSNQPVAALVQHLRAKQQEMKRQQAKRKKETTGAANSSNAKDAKGKGKGKTTKSGKKAGAKADAATGKGGNKANNRNKRPKKQGTEGGKAAAPTPRPAASSK